MNKKQPFEEKLGGQLNDLPVPNVEASWQQMQELLDDKPKRRRFIPFFWLAGALLLGAALTTGGWFYFNHINSNATTTAQTSHSKNNTAPVITNDSNGENEPNQHSENDLNKTQQIPDTGIQTTTIETEVAQEDKSTQKQANTYPSQVREHKTNNSVSRQTIIATAKKKSIHDAQKDDRISRQENKNIVMQPTPAADLTGKAGKKQSMEATEKQQAMLPAIPTTQQTTSTKANDNSNNIDAGDEVVTTDPVTAAVTPAGEDTTTSKNNIITRVAEDTTARQADSSVSVKAGDSTGLKKALGLSLSAGIALQQAIPVAGQKFPAYNMNAGKNILSDYIPSVWTRVHYRKWFLHTEFKYAAPMLVKETAFERHTRYDKVAKDLIVNSSHLKKAYYHQLPVSLNYQIRPDWSVGLGVAFHWLHATVSEHRTTLKNQQTAAVTATGFTKATGFTDSFFYKNQHHITLETEYQVKRFSFGLRYSYGLQPYLTYTTPAGEVVSETLQSLNLVVRYRLWQKRQGSTKR